VDDLGGAGREGFGHDLNPFYWSAEIQLNLLNWVIAKTRAGNLLNNLIIMLTGGNVSQFFTWQALVIE
jgi:hypothetical protein